MGPSRFKILEYEVLKWISLVIASIIIRCRIYCVWLKDTLEDVSLGQLGRLYFKTDSLSKLSLTEARRSLEGQNALPRTEQSFVFHIVEWKVLDSYNSACSAPYLQTKGK